MNILGGADATGPNDLQGQITAYCRGLFSESWGPI